MNRTEIDRGWAQLESGNPAAAEAAVGQGEDAPAARVLRGIARLEQGDHGGACADFDAVLAIQPENAVARLHRGLARFHGGDRTGAVGDFTTGPIFPERQWVKRALRTFWPLHFQHPEILAQGVGEPRLPDGWETEVDRAREKGTPAERTRLAAKLAARGVKAYFAKEHRLSLWCFENALELNPEDRESAANACWVGLRIGEIATARRLMEPMIDSAIEGYRAKRQRELMPSAGMTAMYAWLLHEEGAHRQALATLSTMRPEGPDDYHAHIVAALCWMMLGEKEKGDACFDVALGEFFLDTWQQFVEPYLGKVFRWLAAEPSVG